MQLVVSILVAVTDTRWVEQGRTASTDYECASVIAADHSGEYQCNLLIDHPGDHEQWEWTGSKREPIARWPAVPA
jgi:hypothetical protein